MSLPQRRPRASFGARRVAVPLALALVGGVLLVARDDGRGPAAEDAVPLEEATTTTIETPEAPVGTSSTTTTSTSPPDGTPAGGPATADVGLSIRYPDTTFATGTDDRVEPVVRGGAGPRRFSLASGVLPPGVALDPATGALTTTAITYDRSYDDEAVDPSFAPMVDGTVLAVAVDADGRTLVGGDFASVDGVARRNLARLLPDGSVDPSFDPSPSGAVHAIAVDRMDRVLVGGDFASVLGVPTSRIARLASEGYPDPGFRPDPDGTVRALALEPDGDILVGGSFTTIAGTPRNRIARLDPSGTPDPAFAPDTDGTVRALALEPDGDILVGGSFTTIAGTPRNRIARLDPGGAADPGFAPDVNGPVHAIAVQADGRLLVGGSFTTIAGTPRNRIARLAAMGDIDARFDPGADNPVAAIAVRTDGRVLVGGPFATVAGAPRVGLARLGGFDGYPAALTVRVSDRTGTATASFALALETRPPAEPLAIRTEPGPTPGSLRISWMPPADSGSGPVTDYVVEYRPIGAAGWATYPDGVSTNPSIVVPDLPTDVVYEFRVIAVNVGGTGPPAAPGTDLITPVAPVVPGAPGTPTAVPAPGSVTLTWTAPTTDGGAPVTDYLVERRALPSGAWTVVTVEVGAATTAVVSGLAPGDASEFRVAAVNAAGVGPWSGSASATTPTAPSAPGSLTATPGDGQLALTWTAPAETGGAGLLDYAVEYRTAPTGAWTPVADGTSTAPTATVTGLANGTTYEVRVAAVNGVGPGTWTTPVAATPRTVPGPPGTPATAPNDGRITLTWTTPSVSGGAPVTDYVIEHRTLPSGPWTAFADTVTTGTTVAVTGLANGTAYELRVAAVNEAGTGAWSTVVSATPRTTASAPGTPTATVGNGQLQLGWAAPSNDGGAAVTDYTVEYRAVGETVWVELADGVNPAPGAVVSGLTNGTAYEVRVAARTAAGVGAWSPVVTATPLAVPDAPTALTATPDDAQVALAWTAGADNGGPITDYLVEIRTGGGAWSTFADGTAATTGATVTGLTNGTTVELRVAAVNAAGAGPWAGPVSTTPRTTPAAPTALAATPGDATVDLAWAVPAADGGAAVTDYQVRFRPVGTLTWTTVDDGTSTATTLTLSGLDNGTGYELGVRAVNAAGTGPWAGPVTATPRTTPGSPGALTATPGNGQVSLAWSAPAADGGSPVTDYVIEYRTLPSGTWTVVPDVVGTGTSVTVTGLVNGAGHAFRVSAVTQAGAGTPAGPVTATPRTVPDAPGTPSVTPGDGELQVTWSAPATDGGAAITDYALEYRTLPSGSWTAVADGVSAATTRTLTGLTNGTAYEVRVAAVNAAGTGFWSAAATGTPRRSAGAPTALSATPGDTIVVLAWTAPGSDGGSPVTDYAVEYRVLPSGSWTAYADTVTATTGATVAGLTNGTTYELRVAAVNAAGTGAWSDPVAVTPRTVPGTPTALAATPGDTTVTLTWTAPTDGGAAITDYTIEYRSLPSGSWTVLADAVTATTGAILTGLTNGTTYELRVAAVNAAGTGASTAAVQATPRTGPTSPAALTATPGDTTVALTWTPPGSDGGDAITDYTVEYRVLPAGAWTVFTDAISPSTGATVTDLTNGTAYGFRVAARNAAGTGEWSDPVTATPRTIPGAPASLTASPADQALVLAWSAPGDTGGGAVTDYTVEYRALPSGTWTSFADAVTAGTGVTVTGLTNGTTYELRVAAVNAAGTGPWSAATTGTPRTVPGAPASLVATPGDSTVALAWTAPASDGGSPVADYTIEYRISGATAWTVFADGTSSSTGATVTGLTNGTTYELRVAAVNTAGTGTWTTAVTATPRTTPAAPTGLTATPGNTTATLTWTAPTDGGAAITDYTIEYRSLPSGAWTTFADAVSSSTTAVVTGLTNGTTYELRVAAVNTAGTGPAGAAVEATPRTTPAAPTSLTATAGNTQVALTWVAPGTSGGATVTDYVVEYRVAGETTWSVFAEGAGTTPSATVTGLTNGTTYELRVAAVNAAGTGNWSTAVTATPRTTPTAPTGLNADPGNTSASLSWTSPASNGGAAVTDYTIQYSTDSGTTWTPYTDGASTATTAAVTGLTNGTAHQFRVAAVNPAGTGPWSTIATATPRAAPDAPVALSATAGNTEIALTWNAPTADGGAAITDYSIDYRESGASTWIPWNDPVGTTTGATVTGLANGTTYELRVAAVNAAGTGTWTAPVQATPRTVPGAPTAVNATPGGSFTLTVTWTAPASTGGAAITDYALQYSTDNGATWTSYTDGVSAATTATVSGLVNGTSHLIRVAAVNLAGAGAWSTPVTATPSSFTDATAALNLGDLGSSFDAEWGDRDGDGDLDLVIVQYNSTSYLSGLNILHRNDGDGTFTRETFGSSGNNLDAAFGDYDGDGDLDLHLAKSGSSNPGQLNLLYRNDGPSTFSTASAGIGSNRNSWDGRWADYDGDGDLDLFVANNTQTGGSAANLLYRNNGAGSFTDVAVAAGVAGSVGSISATWADYDDDGDPDLYVSNGGGASVLHRNEGDGTFIDVTAAAGVTVAGTARGTAFGDYDGDGDLDLYVPNSVGAEVLFQNDGDGTFTDVTTTAGILGDVGTTIDGQWADTDNDGDLDLVVGRSSGASRLYRNDGDGTFTASDLELGAVSDLELADYDGDGDLDLISANGSGANVFLRNDRNPSAGTSQAVQLTRGGAVNRHAVTVDLMAGATRVATRIVGAAPVLFTGLNPGTTYSFRYRCHGGAVVTTAGGTPSATLASVEQVCPPAAPTGVAATPGTSQVTLSWTAPTGTNGAAVSDYVVAHSTDGGTTWTPFADGTSTATSATVTGLTNGTAHLFRVAAVNAAGVGAWSTTATATPAGPPGVPLDLTATPDDGSVTLTWSTPAANGSPITDYEIDVRALPSGSFATFADGVSTATTAIVTGLGNGTSYELRVRGVNAAGSGAWATTDAMPVGPWTPRSLPDLALWYDAADASTLTVSGGLVDEWRDKSGNGSHVAATGTARPGFNPTGFDGRPAVTFDGVNDQLALAAPVGVSRNATGQTIMAALERTGGETTFGTVFGSVTSTAGFARSTLFVGSTAVQVGGRRLDSDGYQFASRSATGRMVAGGVFDWANAALHLGVNGTWTSRSGGFQTAGATSDTASSAGGIGNAGVGEFFGGSVPEVVVTRSALSTTDRNRLEGYLAHKWGTAGSLPAEHPYRNHPPMISPPTAPIALTATGGSQAATLSWTAPANPGISTVTDYLVDYRQDGGTTWIRFEDGTSATTSATVTGLTTGTLYEFRVAAVNTLGAGAWSNIATAAPPQLGLAYADTNFSLGGPDSLLPTVTGGAASGRTFTLDAGTLPSGVSLDPTTGALSTTGATYTDAVDAGFAPSVNGTIETIAFQADGKVLLGGSFTTVDGVTRGRIARLNADGTLDTGFSQTFSDTVETIVVEPDGQILVGGQFLTVGGVTRNRIARLNADGTLDASFNPNASSTVFAIALQPDGRIVIGGGFGTVDGQARSRIARLNADGSLDSGFNPGAGAGVSALAIQSDGKILLGGSFTLVAGQTRNRIARVNADGTLDTSFNPGAGNTVHALAVQADGRILVGGAFTTIGGQTRNNIARLTAAGAVETQPNLTSNGDVNALLQLPDGTTAFGGGFTTLSGQTRNRIARLALSGSLDTTWNPSSDGAVNALVADPNGRLVAGGAFTTLGGQARNRIARFGGVPGYPATITIRVTDATGTATTTFALQAGAS